MSVVEDKDRQVIPRWRNYKHTVKCGQLRSPKKIIETKFDTNNLIENKILAWNKEKNLAYATDLVSSAFVLGEMDKVEDAVKYIKKYNTKNLLINSVLDASEVLDESKVDNVSDLDRKAIDQGISSIRKILIESPNNAIAWTELSHFYTLNGLRDKAEKAMKVSLSLAPNNRFILRSAARLYVHLDQSARAHDILLGAQSVYHDPWLASAEIAIAHAANRKSKNIKKSKKLVESKKFNNWDVNELASALATIELENGKHKIAKKLFKQSLLNPTENSIAQVGWANRRDSNIILPRKNLSIPNTFEARAWHFHENNDWKNASIATENWLFDQPFSSRPAIMGSYLNALVFEDYKRSNMFCKRGLVCNPDNITLKNNLAFNLIKKGELVDGEKLLISLDKVSLKEQELVMCTATKGLLQYRKGNPSEGRKLYLDSIRQANKLNSKRLVLIASCFYALEEYKFDLINAKNIFETALKKSKKTIGSGIDILITRVTNELYK